MKKDYLLTGTLILTMVWGICSCKSAPGAGNSVPAPSVPESGPTDEYPGDQNAEFPAEYPRYYPQELKTGNFVFIPASLPSLEPAPGVGYVTRESRDRGSGLSAEERDALLNSFQAAYADNLLRGQALNGVLGGDQVHGWPENSPSGWVQNWQTSAPRPNSWGIPSLVLAIQGVEILRTMAQDRVFLVHGEILDIYGKSAGVKNANGSAGYGSPRGDEFFYNEGIAQRFDLGLIMADKNGKGTFIVEEAPSETEEIPPELGAFPGSRGGAPVQNAFLTAWKMALDRKADETDTLVPDGPGQYLSFSEAYILPGLSAAQGMVRGLYIQTFNQGSSVLVLPDSAILPPHVRFLGYSLLQLFLAPEEYAIPGAESLEVLKFSFSGGDGFAGQLMKGFAQFGIPLSDPLPRKNEDGLWEEAQRFSRGWIVRSSPEQSESED